MIYIIVICIVLGAAVRLCFRCCKCFEDRPYTIGRREEPPQNPSTPTSPTQRIGRRGPAQLSPFRYDLRGPTRSPLIYDLREPVRSRDRIPLAKVRPLPDATTAKSRTPARTSVRPQKVIPTRQECSICLETIERDSVYCCKCGHCFHRACIVEWNKTSNTCPLCRQPCL